MAAILRAKVSRAKCGFTPWARRLGKIPGKVPRSRRLRRCTLEDIFQIVIMVAVEPADGQNFLGAFQLASDEAIFPTGVRRSANPQ